MLITKILYICYTKKNLWYFYLSQLNFYSVLYEAYKYKCNFELKFQNPISCWNEILQVNIFIFHIKTGEYLYCNWIQTLFERLYIIQHTTPWMAFVSPSVRRYKIFYWIPTVLYILSDYTPFLMAFVSLSVCRYKIFYWIPTVLYILSDYTTPWMASLSVRHYCIF